MRQSNSLVSDILDFHFLHKVVYPLDARLGLLLVSFDSEQIRWGILTQLLRIKLAIGTLFLGEILA